MMLALLLLLGNLLLDLFKSRSRLVAENLFLPFRWGRFPKARVPQSAWQRRIQKIGAQWNEKRFRAVHRHPQTKWRPLMPFLRIAAVLCASAALIPAAALAQTQNQQVAGNECKQLEEAVQQRQGQSGRITMDQVRTWQKSQDHKACREALREVAGVQVQEGEQAQVTVQQPPAQVEIRQPQPEIVVHQPAPKVTVEIPQPQITIRMPQLEAKVSQAQPEVQVYQPQPQVQVTKPQQQSQVQIQQEGQPQVRYDMEEPQVMVKRAEGQPQVRVEQMQASEGNQQPLQAARVADLKKMGVYNTKGEQIGDVKQVILDTKGKTFLIIRHGSFLGLGEKEVALPAETLVMQDDRLIVRGMTDDQIKAMPAWKEDATGVREIGDDDTVQLSYAVQ